MMQESSGRIDAAQAFYDRGRYADAIRVLRDALAGDPDNWWAHTLLALAYAEDGKLDAALATARVACALRPAASWPLLVLSVVQLRRGKLGEAENAARAAIANDPNDDQSFWQLAIVQMQRNHPRSAIVAAEAGLAINAQNDQLYVALGAANIALHRYRKAQAALDRARAIAPDEPALHTILAVLATKRDRPIAAASEYREALRLKSGDAFSREGLVEALRRRSPLYRITSSRFAPALTVVWLAVGYLSVERDVLPGVEFAVAMMLAAFLAEPLATLSVLLDRDGRRSLLARERNDAIVLAAALLLVAAIGTWAFLARTEVLAITASASATPAVLLCTRRWRDADGPKRVRRFFLIGIAAWYAASAIGLRVVVDDAPTRLGRGARRAACHLRRRGHAHLRIRVTTVEAAAFVLTVSVIGFLIASGTKGTFARLADAAADACEARS